MEKTRTRILSSIVGLMLLMAVAVLGRYAISAGIFLFSILGIYEFYKAAENKGYKPIRILGYAACIPVLLLGFSNIIFKFENEHDIYIAINAFLLALFTMVVLLLAATVFIHERFNFIDAGVTLIGIAYIPFLSSFIVLTCNLDKGSLLIWFIFIGAWVTDTSAYIFGRTMGRHKMLPTISPKKTVEGFIGGVFGCVLITAAYGISLEALHQIENINVIFYILLGFINGVVSQVGDWSASAVKRYTGIKDYGKIMPGHGGVLDRFDSILFTAPIVYFFMFFAV